MNKIIFIDTNILIHFKYFLDIKWNEIVGSATAIIIITSPVLNELEKLKYDTNIKKQERAKKITKKLEELIISESDTARITDYVSIRLLLEEPKSDLFEELNLDPSIQDHRIIASAYEYKRKNPAEEIMIISDDISLRLTSKKYSIDVTKLSEDLMLEPGNDERDKKIANLTKELNTLKKTIPDVNITYENQLTFKEYVLKKPDKELSEDMILKWMSELKLKYPEKQMPKLSANGINNQELVKLITNIPFSDNEKYYKKYNEELATFYNKYIEYQKFTYRAKSTKNYVIFLDLYVNNNGFAPAKGLDIILHFPDGFELYDDKEMKSKIKEPKPPILGNALSSLIYPDFNMSSDFLKTRPITPQNVSGYDIKKSNSSDVKFTIISLKHNQSEKLNPLYIIFDSYDSAASFSFDYKIQADNIPIEQKGTLSVVINKANLIK
jgi:PIN domain